MGCRYVLHDRDVKFCATVDDGLNSEGILCLRLPPRSPNLKAYASQCTSFERSATTDTAGQRILSFLPCAFRGPAEPEGWLIGISIRGQQRVRGPDLDGFWIDRQSDGHLFRRQHSQLLAIGQSVIEASIAFGFAQYSAP